MNIKSKQSILALLAGMIAGLLFTVFVPPACWGMVLGVFVAAYFARVSSPEDGAVVGAIALIPVGIYLSFQGVIQAKFLENIGMLATLPIFFIILVIAIVLISVIGALFGLVIGKLFQITKDKNLIL